MKEIPSQYKAAWEVMVIDTIILAEKMAPILGELGCSTVIESENVVVTIAVKEEGDEDVIEYEDGCYEF